MAAEMVAYEPGIVLIPVSWAKLELQVSRKSKKTRFFFMFLLVLLTSGLMVFLVIFQTDYFFL
jgi:hypothetical protein